MIHLKNVTIGYNGLGLLKPISINFSKGDFWGIVGPNGGGKTTLIRTILGIIPPIKNRVKFVQEKPRFGYVPQRHAVSSHFPLTAFDVVLMGRYDKLGIGKQPNSNDRQRAHQELIRVGLESVSNKNFDSLSGGQRQRVLMARALVSDPDVLVLDEPTTGMDLPGESKILSFLRKLHAERKITIIMVEHHIDKVVSVAGHLCFINKRDNQFDSGILSELLNETKLSTLYNQKIKIHQINSEYHVHALGEN